MPTLLFEATFCCVLQYCHNHSRFHDDAWLCISISTADRAVREMNQKEKDIIRAYLKAVKYAHHLESRVRIMLIGDRDTGEQVDCWACLVCAFDAAFYCKFSNKSRWALLDTVFAAALSCLGCADGVRCTFKK